MQLFFVIALSCAQLMSVEVVITLTVSWKCPAKCQVLQVILLPVIVASVVPTCLTSSIKEVSSTSFNSTTPSLGDAGHSVHAQSTDSDLHQDEVFQVKSTLHYLQTIFQSHSWLAALQIKTARWKDMHIFH